ncbi:VOC family protein [Cohnella zeiphila]|uniref:Glyoxalase/bleomycin resistance/dioxygenase family protein n=1 Tax=Cohnella zeiphila TaxID=2761120 RepID=A0A7X0STM3_9BACL|nr:VOC family protein [Cohnella zeiphila]MBB6733668.1 glyoxalase/bleomycin resistance/dioxygenase family protein [Cohnella zeiphila]
MITHYASVGLPTVSLAGVRQFYGDRLAFPIESETPERIVFRPTPHFALAFTDSYTPTAPAHLAFEVASSAFEEAVSRLKEAGVPPLRWEDGSEVDRSETGRNVYFRDGDGHLLELICHEYVRESVLPACGPFGILYLREAGFPLADMPSFREWARRVLRMKTAKESDDFTFAIGGTAHAVLVAKTRRWIPIAMAALPPAIDTVFGVPDGNCLNEAEAALAAEGVPYARSGGEVRFRKDGYDWTLRLTADFPPDLPARLGLPLSR